MERDSNVIDSHISSLFDWLAGTFPALSSTDNSFFHVAALATVTTAAAYVLWKSTFPKRHHEGTRRDLSPLLPAVDKLRPTLAYYHPMPSALRPLSTSYPSRPSNVASLPASRKFVVSQAGLAAGPNSQIYRWNEKIGTTASGKTAPTVPSRCPLSLHAHPRHCGASPQREGPRWLLRQRRPVDEKANASTSTTSAVLAGLPFSGSRLGKLWWASVAFWILSRVWERAAEARRDRRRKREEDRFRNLLGRASSTATPPQTNDLYTPPPAKGGQKGSSTSNSVAAAVREVAAEATAPAANDKVLAGGRLFKRRRGGNRPIEITDAIAKAGSGSKGAFAVRVAAALAVWAPDGRFDNHVLPGDLASKSQIEEAEAARAEVRTRAITEAKAKLDAAEKAAMASGAGLGDKGVEEGGEGEEGEDRQRREAADAVAKAAAEAAEDMTKAFEAAEQPVEDPIAQSVADLGVELGIEPTDKANVLADVAHAMVATLIDEAGDARESDEQTVQRVRSLLTLMEKASTMLGVVAPGVTVAPVRYGGRLGRGKLEAVFRKYLAAQMESGLGGMMGPGGLGAMMGAGGGLGGALGGVDPLEAIEKDDPMMSPECLERLQRVLGIKDATAERIGQRVMMEQMTKMMKDAKANGGLEGLGDALGGLGGPGAVGSGVGGLGGGLNGAAAGAGGAPGDMPSPEDVKEMIDMLQAEIDAGGLSVEEVQMRQSMMDMLRAGAGEGSEADAIKLEQQMRDTMMPVMIEMLSKDLKSGALVTEAARKEVRENFKQMGMDVDSMVTAMQEEGAGDPQTEQLVSLLMQLNEPGTEGGQGYKGGAGTEVGGGGDGNTGSRGDEDHQAQPSLF